MYLLKLPGKHLSHWLSGTTWRSSRNSTLYQGLQIGMESFGLEFNNAILKTDVKVYIVEQSSVVFKFK